MHSKTKAFSCTIFFSMTDARQSSNVLFGQADTLLGTVPCRGDGRGVSCGRGLADSRSSVRRRAMGGYAHDHGP